MPQWTVQDDNGDTLVLEGDSEPTEQELEEIFSSRKPAAPPTAAAPALEPPSWLPAQTESPLTPANPAAGLGYGAGGAIAPSLLAMPKGEDAQSWSDYVVSSAAQGGIGLEQGFRGIGDTAWTAIQAANEPILELGPVAFTASGIQPTAQARARARSAREIALEARKSVEALQPLAEEIGGSQAMRSIGSAAGGLPVVLAAGPAGPAAAIGAAGLQQGFNTLSQAQSKFEELPEERGTGFGPNREFWNAAPAAAADAVTTAAITAVSGKLFGAGLEGATAPIKKAAIERTIGSRLKEVFGEALEEGAQQFVSDYVIGGMSYHPDVTFDEALKNSIEAAKAGGVLGAAVSGVRAATERGTPARPPVIPDTQLQSGVPREGISAEVGKPVEVIPPPEAVTEAAPSLQSVLEMTPEQYFDTSSQWSAEAMSEKGGINPQVRAELAARANPDLKAWQEAQSKASSDFAAVKKEVAEKPDLMGDPSFQKRFTGAAQRASFFSEGRAILDGSKQPNARTVELSEAPTDAVNNLVPAVKYKGEVHIGQPGETHAKLINRVFENDPEAKVELQNMTPESEAARGFARDGTTEFIDRNTSAEMVGMKPENGKRPVLYSEWLNELRAKAKPSEPTSANALPRTTAAAEPRRRGSAAVTPEATRQENLRKQALREVERQRPTPVRAKNAPTQLQELDSLIIQRGLETGRIDDLELLHSPRETATSNIGSGIKAKVQYNSELKSARERVASDFGISKARMETPAGRSELLAKLKEIAARPELPKLRPGEKGTGELLQGKDEPFNLVRENALDVERIDAEKKAKEDTEKAADEFEEKNQTDMFPEGVGEPSDWDTALDKASKWADDVLSRDPRSRTRTGIDPSEEAKRLAAIAIKGAILIRNGVRDFAAWSKQMLEQYGPSIQASLNDLWNRANAIVNDPETAIPPAPGAKTKESGGVWFAGKNPQETATMMQERADAFLKGKTDQQAIEDLTSMAGGDQSVQLDNQAANFVIKDLLVRASNRAQKTTDPVESVEAWSQVDRLAELSRRLGSEDARSLVSRKLAYRQIDWLMPVLAWRGIVKDKWRKALGIPEGQPLNESVITPEEAKKRGLPELNGAQTRKITKLSKDAEKLPQGIRRNKVMDEMVKEIQSGVPISKLDLLRDIWYASVLMRVGTFINVLAGSYATGASFTAMAALDRTVRLHPVQAMKIVGQFIGGTIEGTLIAKEVASKGAWHLLPDAELRFSNLLSGKAGARFDNLENLLRRRNPLGVLAYTRRFMAALDYIGAEGTRDSQVLYAALTRNDQTSLDALDKRFDRDENKRAGEQARAEMGPKASRAEVMVRKREILEQGVSEELKEAAINTARRAAQNATPRGIPGIIYQGASKLPFWVRAPTGLAFIRAGMNMVQNAVDYMPGIGAVSAARGGLGALPDNHPMKRFGLDIPIEERRMMWAAQGASLGIAIIAAALFLGDDKDEGWEISGSWRGLDSKKRSQLMELGERPNSIRFGKKGPWISFKQMPFAPPLAIIGTMRDEERFHKADWDGESAANKITSAWLGGLLYIRDLSALSGIAGMFDGNAWNTQQKPTKMTEQLSKWGAQSVGRAVAGYIPSIIKEIDEFGDQSLYRPGKDELMGYWIRNVPYARRTVGEGPALNNFGEPIQLTPPPIKSWVGFGKDDELYKTLGSLASKGIFIPEPNRNAKIVDQEDNKRVMTEDEWYRFIKERGTLLKASFTPRDIQWLKTVPNDEAIEWLKVVTDEARDAARAEIGF